jgi:tRNA pseudouridine(38-40) synthase
MGRKTPKNPHAYTLLISFTGTNFIGAQYNLEGLSIHGIILEALAKMSLIQSSSPLGVGIHSTSRTDRGVHALRMLVAVHLLHRIEELYSDNENYIQRFCEDINRELELIGKETKDVDKVRSKRNIVVHDVKPMRYDTNLITYCTGRIYHYLVPRKCIINDKLDDTTMITKLNEYLQLYEGKHSFHNFTSLDEYENYVREMYSIRVHSHKPILTIGNQNYVIVRLHGKGFMIHQIRRMISLALIALNNNWDVEFVSNALELDHVVHIPRSPGEFLYLDTVEFSKAGSQYIQWSKETEQKVIQFREIIDNEIHRLNKLKLYNQSYPQILKDSSKTIATQLKSVRHLENVKEYMEIKKEQVQKAKLKEKKLKKKDKDAAFDALFAKYHNNKNKQDNTSSYSWIAVIIGVYLLMIVLWYSELFA